MPQMSAVMKTSTAQQSALQSSQVQADILANAVPILQNVRSGSFTYAAGSPTVVNMQASNVGFIRRFFLEISGTVNCASTYTLTPTQFGLKNLISNVQFTDQNNRLRINTSGIHLHLGACEKRRRPFGVAMVASTGINDDSGIGANFPVQTGTGVVTGGTAKNFTFVLEIPVINANTDLTGGIYANQTTSNNQLQFTMNPSAVVYNADPYNAAYTASAAVATALPTFTNMTWTLYQDMLDQLPVGTDGYAVLPQSQIAWALCFQLINLGVQVAGNDNLYALPPFNVYSNLMLFWDNYQYGSVVGSDVTYIKVQVSNTYVLRQWDALLLSVMVRNIMGVDMPAAANTAAGSFSGGVYSLDFRHRPLSVNQLSSTNIVFRPNTVQSATSTLNIGQEYLWLANN